MLFEASHGLWIMPAGAGQIIIVLVAIFFESAPQLGIGHVTTEGTTAHLIILHEAGVTRVDMISMRIFIFLCGGEGRIRTHGGLSPTSVFRTAALNHSATSPENNNPSGGALDSKSARELIGCGGEN